MCRKLLFLIVLLFVTVNAQWVQTNGPYGGNVKCLAFNGTFLFAGIGVGVYLSTNNGTSWTPANTGLPGYPVLSLAMGVTGDLFCGTNGGGIYISTNNGTSWNADTSGLTNNVISSIAANGKNLFAGTYDGGIFLSTNNGTNWTPVNNGLSISNGMYVSSLFVSPTGTGDTNLFAGTYAGIYRSTNNGTSWTSVWNGNGTINNYQFAVSSNGAGGTNLFAGFSTDGGRGGGIALSTNNGTSWTQLDLNNTSTGGCLSLAAIPNDTGGVNVYAGMYPDLANNNQGGCVFLSTNNGISWTVVDSGLTNNLVQTISYRPNYTPNGPRGANIFAGTQAGVYLSTNYGTSWSSVNSGLPFANVLSLAANTIAISGIGTTLAEIFAGTNGGVFIYTTNGINWTAINKGLNYYNVNSLAVTTGDSGGRYIFAGTEKNIYLSTNNGTSWDSSLDLPEASFIGAAPNGTGGINIFAGAPNSAGGFLISTNNGASWAHTSLFGSGYYGSFAEGPGGTNILVGGLGEIFISTNNGTNWTQSDSGLPGTPFTTVAVIPNGTSGMNYFAGTIKSYPTDIPIHVFAYGVYRSTNNGISWTAVDSGLPYGFVYSFAVSNTNLFAGTSGGVFLSTNSGTNWTAVNTGLPNNEEVTSLAVSGTNLFAGTYGSGVWMRPISEMITGVTGKQDKSPASFSLQQNYPNPFNPSTIINYSLPKTSLVTIKVYDVLGKEVATLVNEQQFAGNYSVQFSGSKLSSGIYFYRMQAGNFVQTKKLLLLK